MTTPRVTVPVDTFSGDNAALVASISALLETPDASLSARVPGMAKQLLASAAARLSAAPAPEGGAVEDLREALIQADLKIRSLPGTDQSDVEFIREALATREEAPAEAGEDLVSAIDAFMPSAEVAFLWSKETPPADEVQRYRERYWAVKEALLRLRAQPPAREDAKACYDCATDRPHRMTEACTRPAPDALRVAVEAVTEIRDGMVAARQDISVDDWIEKADQALAALQQEGRDRG